MLQYQDAWPLNNHLLYKQKTPLLGGAWYYLTFIDINVVEIDFPSISQQSSLYPIFLNPTFSNKDLAFLFPEKTPKSIQWIEGRSRHHWITVYNNLLPNPLFLYTLRMPIPKSTLCKFVGSSPAEICAFPTILSWWKIPQALLQFGKSFDLPYLSIVFSLI